MGFLATSLSSVDGVGGVLRYRGVSLDEFVAGDVDYGRAVAVVVDGVFGDRSASLLKLPVPFVDVGGEVYASLRRAMSHVVDSGDAVEVAGACGRAVSRLRGRFVDKGSYAARVLRGIADGDVSDGDVKDFDRCLVVHLDHALNPSTLACRVVASTGAPLVSSLTAALCALEGPLHGGASSDVGRVLEDEIQRPDDALAWFRAQRAQRKKVPGFGHPIYKARDPRAPVLRALCERAADRRKNRRFVDVAAALADVVAAESGGRLFPNVDFYAAALYATLGVPRRFHTACFFAARVAGQAAHAVEQQARGRIISPEADDDGGGPRALADLPRS